MYSRKRQEDNRGISGYKVFLTFVSFVAIVSMTVMIYLALMQDDSNLERTGYGLFAGGFIIMSCLAIYETFRDSKFMVFHFTERLKEGLDDFIETLNDDWEERGIRWHFDNDHAMIECHIQTDLEIIEEVGGENESHMSEDSIEEQRKKQITKLNKQIKNSSRGPVDQLDSSRGKVGNWGMGGRAH